MRPRRARRVSTFSPVLVAVALAVVEAAHDVDVVQRHGDPRLAQEALAELRRRLGALRQHLQRDDAVELHVARPPHDAGGALAETLDHLVAADAQPRERAPDLRGLLREDVALARRDLVDRHRRVDLRERRRDVANLLRLGRGHEAAALRLRKKRIDVRHRHQG
jgi:hypothetical protein